MSLLQLVIWLAPQHMAYEMLMLKQEEHICILADPLVHKSDTAKESHVCAYMLQVYVYYKAMTKPVCRRFFSTAAEVASNSHSQDPSQFISAVCWKPHSQILLSANSQGTIKLMQLTS